MNKRILSTKILSRSQKELLLNAGLGVVEQNFISIIPLEFQINKLPKNLIFTSKNAVKAVLDHPEVRNRKTYCVGQKTAALLDSEGFTVIETANYGSELADKILASAPTEEFLFFCGQKRNPDLSRKLREHNVPLTEVEVYDTRLTPTKIDCTFDGVLFFSPSAVESYTRDNDLSQSTAFCIGDTTASEANKYTGNVITATTPSIENVIVKVIKYFKQQ